MAFYHHETNSLYIHVPKAYGTSIANALVRSGFVKLTPRDTMDYDRGTLEFTMDLFRDDAELRRKYPKFDIKTTFIFSFIREPVSRLKSGMKYSKLSLDNIKKGTFNLYQFHHTIMPQTKHLELPDKIGLHHISFIGICERFEKDWKHLEKILQIRGLKRNLANIIHYNKAKPTTFQITQSDNELNTFCKNYFKEDVVYYDNMKLVSPMLHVPKNEVIEIQEPQHSVKTKNSAKTISPPIATGPTPCIYQLHWIGRFGNRIFQYAFVNEWARRNHGHAYIPSHWEGSTLFKPSPYCSIIKDDTLRLAVNQTGKFDNIDFRKSALGRYNKRTNQNITFKDTRTFKELKQVAFDDLNCMYIRTLQEKMDPMKVKELFEFSDAVKNTQVYKDIVKEKGKYIVAHLRRGDISRPHYKGAHSMITKESYHRAFEKFGDKEENIIWLSDDKQERTNMSYMFSKDYYSITKGHQWKYPRGEKKQSESDILFDFVPELLLLVFAKKIYRSNSSFSWFGAFLSDAVVYSPVVKSKSKEAKGGFFQSDAVFKKHNCEPFMGSREEGFQEIYFGTKKC